MDIPSDGREHSVVWRAEISQCDYSISRRAGLFQISAMASKTVLFLNVRHSMPWVTLQGRSISEYTPFVPVQFPVGARVEGSSLDRVSLLAKPHIWITGHCSEIRTVPASNNSLGKPNL